MCNKEWRLCNDDLEVTNSGSRKCEYLFKLLGKSIKFSEEWNMKLLCVSHNHDLEDMMEGHLYADRLTLNGKSVNAC